MTLKSKSAMKTMMPYDSKMARRGTPFEAVRLACSKGVRANLHIGRGSDEHVLDEVVRRKPQVRHTGEEEAVLGHLGNVHAQVAEQRATEEPRAQPRAGDLLGDHRVVPVPPQGERWLVDARGREERHRVGERDQPDGEHHGPRVRSSRRVDLARVRAGGVEAAVAPVQDAHELAPARGGADDEPVGRLDLRHAHGHEHDEGRDHREPQHEQEAAHGVDAEDGGQHEQRRDRDPHEVHPRRHHERVQLVRAREHGVDRVHHEARVDGVIDDAGHPGPVAHLEAHAAPERLAHPRAEARVGRKRREELGERQRQREAPHEREHERGQDAHERPAGRHDGLRAPGPAAHVEVRDERQAHDAQLLAPHAAHGPRALRAGRARKATKRPEKQ
ncbi:unnamed protein product [Phytophthora fragariaefolia]|uniref:Unnamed protein product n=1 Tax=Phytophthora fragariaefolia TaxID=1490495 RepID=A0A9W6YKW3_9STRA|nr:unnamed protein product [Phytophthora fragariaefolia]